MRAGWKSTVATVGLMAVLAGAGWLGAGWIVGARHKSRAATGSSSEKIAAGSDSPTRNSSLRGDRLRPTDSTIRFVEQAGKLGIDFVHVSGINREKHFPAANGSGAGLLDFDGDGLLDIYFLTACPLPVQATPDSPRNRVYRALPDGAYADVTPAAGLGLAGFSQGVGVADVNNDGFPDVYVVALGGNHLFENLGDGTFRDTSHQSGTDTPRWGTSCAFLDYDEDGSTDLYVASYGIWSIETNEYCGDRERGVRLFCRPTYITPEVHTLYRNRGDGTFEETTESAGISRKDGRGQGVIAADVNGDGHVDLYVANDISPNFLFLNKGDGTFRDVTMFSGAAYDADGAALASMGVDATDLDGDGRPELFVTNFYNEYNNLYHNQGEGFFEDISLSSGLGPESLPEVGWGTLLTDLDNDGSPDVLVVNGHVDDNLHELGRTEPYRQRSKVWRYRGRLRFQNVSEAAGDYFESVHSSRGAAFGDLNDDGRTDVVVLNLDEPPAVLVNQSDDSNGWVRLQLIGKSSNRDAVGCWIELEAGGTKQYRAVKGGGSYLSAHDLRMLVGVGKASRVNRIAITWPSGEKVLVNDLVPRKTYRIEEPPKAPPRSLPAWK